MKTYIPNRRPLTDMERASTEKPVRRPSHRRHLIVPTLLISAGVTAVVALAWQGYERHRLSRLQLTQAMEQIERLEHDLKTTSMSFLESQASLSAMATERDTLAVNQDRLRAEQRQLVQRAMGILHQSAEAVHADPVLARGMLDEALDMASLTGGNGAAIQSARNGLPQSQVIPQNTTLEIHRVNRDADHTTIDLSVLDGSGQAIKGLRRAEFDILCGERRLHAVAVTEARESRSAPDSALVLDCSASTKGLASQAAIEGAVHLSKAIANPARLRVWSFSDDVQPLTAWTVDAEIHEQAIRSMSIGGQTALYKSLRLVTEDIQSRTNSRCIILFTDGTDSYRQETIDETLETCRELAIPIHVICLRTEETNESLLQRIASETGGTYHTTGDPTRLADEFQRLTKSLQRPFYRLHVYETLGQGPVAVRLGELTPVAIDLSSVASF